MENFKNNKFVLSLDLDKKYDYIEHLIFDRNDLYLIGYGDTDICVMDLFNKEKQIKKEHKI